MSSWLDMNTADSSSEVIPAGTIVKVIMKLRPGGHDDPAQGWTGGYAKRNATSGSVYLDPEFTIMGGKYNKRKVWSLIGLHSEKGPTWQDMGRQFIRAALESARGIKPNDISEKAVEARRISALGDLDQLVFVAKIGVDEGQGGYEDKNVIASPVTPNIKGYEEAMNGEGQDVPLSVAAASATPAATTPSWAQ